MRYIPMSQYSFDEIVDQCCAAVNRTSQYTPVPTPVDYSEVRKFFRYDDVEVCKFHRMKDYGSLVR